MQDSDAPGWTFLVRYERVSPVIAPPAQGTELSHINPPLLGDGPVDDPASGGDIGAAFVCVTSPLRDDSAGDTRPRQWWRIDLSAGGGG